MGKQFQTQDAFAFCNLSSESAPLFCVLSTPWEFAVFCMYLSQEQYVVQNNFSVTISFRESIFLPTKAALCTAFCWPPRTEHDCQGSVDVHVNFPSWETAWLLLGTRSTRESSRDQHHKQLVGSGTGQGSLGQARGSGKQRWAMPLLV